MRDDVAVEASEDRRVNHQEDLARKYASETLLNPPEAFEKLVTSLTPLEATDFEKVAVIQEAARRYNGVADNARKINLLYHFTDEAGANGMIQQEALGKEGDPQLYLTSIAPDQAKPLFSAKAGKAYEKYFRDKKMPENLREGVSRFIWGLRFKWEHDVLGKIKTRMGQRAIPVGAHKLENVVMVATNANNPLLQRDPHGEIFVERPIKLGGDPDFKTFGPLSTKPPLNTKLS